MIAGTILFVIGSIQMTARPVISFVHDMKLSKYYKRKYKQLLDERSNINRYKRVNLPFVESYAYLVYVRTSSSF